MSIQYEYRRFFIDPGTDVVEFMQAMNGDGVAGWLFPELIITVDREQNITHLNGAEVNATTAIVMRRLKDDVDG